VDESEEAVADHSVPNLDEPLAVYASRREAISGVIVDAIKAGDEPSVVGRADRRCGDRRTAEAAIPGRDGRAACEHAAALRTRGHLRQADPQAQPAARVGD
jgi:hypothetical protein